MKIYSPWWTPFPILNQSDVPCPILTVASWPEYRFLKRQVRWSGICISWIISHSLLWSTQSKTSVVNEAEVDVFSGILLLFQWSSGFGNLISGSSAFSKSSLNSFRVATFYLLPIWGMSSLSFFLPSLLSLILNKDNWASSMCHMIYYRLSA